jgi:hypothetical protein
MSNSAVTTSNSDKELEELAMAFREILKMPVAKRIGVLLPPGLLADQLIDHISKM